ISMKKILVLSLSLSAVLFKMEAATFVITAQSAFSGGNTFSPSTLTIGIGDSVFFTNRSGDHNVIGYNPVETFCGIDTNSPGPMCTVIFTNVGTYQFRCTPHSTGSGVNFSGMVGSINVTSPPLPSLVIITSPVENAFFAAPA